jgi:hypothetical protein
LESRKVQNSGNGGGEIDLPAHNEPGGILDFINRDDPLSAERADLLADLVEACRV